VTHDLQEAAAFSDRLAVMVAGRIVASGRALDLMGRPPSREVAELLGIENILPGEIVGREGGHVRVALQPEGPTVRIATGRESNKLLADRVTVTLPAAAGRVLRTEQPVPPEWNRVTGVVREVQWLASGARLIVETPALVAALAPWDPTASPWSVGERAVVMFAPEAAHLIPEAR
jgi:ABC-type Fe3+/spermidine/putrescine transport system ATPase subunit